MSTSDGVQSSPDNDGRRLWIGNLDQRVTEFVLIKILQKYGSLEKFDYLYHKTGPDAGRPRGYCFVTFTHLKDAEIARKGLDGKLALGKRLVVRLAHAEEETETSKGNDQLPGSSSGTVTVDSKIRAIEMKLNHMEQTSSEFVMTTKPAAVPGTSIYSSVQQANRVTSIGGKQTGRKQTSKPYVRRDRYK